MADKREQQEAFSKKVAEVNKKKGCRTKSKGCKAQEKDGRDYCQS
tara:strand:+ start:141 stop:275 length:135 start_codon:yes stop_codon:yes gene_type:complete